MAWLAMREGQSLPSASGLNRRQRSARQGARGGPKGPPSAPPAIPPIIITPFSYERPGPAIDPRVNPPKPPITQHRPCITC